MICLYYKFIIKCSGNIRIFNGYKVKNEEKFIMVRIRRTDKRMSAKNLAKRNISKKILALWQI